MADIQTKLWVFEAATDRIQGSITRIHGSHTAFELFLCCSFLICRTEDGKVSNLAFQNLKRGDPKWVLPFLISFETKYNQNVL